MKKHRSKFEAWVYSEGGLEAVANQINVSKSAVGHWCNRFSKPGLEACNSILKLANGKLTLNDILEGTRKCK